MIFNIQRFSTHDGIGIRTVVFYKGCPLSCWWCSNPESQSFDYSVLYHKKFCQNFGDCIKVESKAIIRNEKGLQIDRSLIKNPETLRNVCLTKALTISGEKLSVEEILTEIEKDLPFYRTDGGVTLSGGEPLSQGENMVELLRELKQMQISVNMETTLHVKWEKLERCIGLVDTFLADLKHTNKEKFKKHTGGDSLLVMSNLVKLDHSGANYVIRIPVIPGFNHTEKEIFELIDFASSLKNAKEINFLPYHTFGEEKYKMLDLPYKMKGVKPVEDRELAPYLQYAKGKGFQAKIGG
ncbi:MAG TPA: glycyl-radical enzyme activating protein [Draconibacterium sp.]|nr:glycyl-radical enzyme activating protein [Draconibacterium sp.]